MAPEPLSPAAAVQRLFDHSVGLFVPGPTPVRLDGG